MELFLAGEKALALRVANKALLLYKNNPPPPVSPTLVALLIALGMQKEANELAAPPDQGVFPVEARLGHAAGMVLTKDDWENARKLALFPGGGEDVDRVQSLLALADLAIAKNKPDEAATLIAEAAKRINQLRVTPWMRFQLVHGGPHGKAAEMASWPRPTSPPRIAAAEPGRSRSSRRPAQPRGRPATAEMQAEAEKNRPSHPRWSLAAQCPLRQRRARAGRTLGTRIVPGSWPGRRRGSGCRTTPPTLTEAAK